MPGHGLQRFRNGATAAAAAGDGAGAAAGTGIGRGGAGPPFNVGFAMRDAAKAAGVQRPAVCPQPGKSNWPRVTLKLRVDSPQQLQKTVPSSAWLWLTWWPQQ